MLTIIVSGHSCESLRTELNRHPAPIKLLLPGGRTKTLLTAADVIAMVEILEIAAGLEPESEEEDDESEYHRRWNEAFASGDATSGPSWYDGDVENGPRIIHSNTRRGFNV